MGKIPEDVVAEMAEIAPMLSHFGYNPNGELSMSVSLAFPRPFRGYLDTSTAQYFYRACKNSVRKLTDNLSNMLFQRKMYLNIGNNFTFSLSPT